MTRILLRTPKSPFEVFGLDAVLESGLLGDNTGNLVFLHAAYRLLATPGTTITPDRLHVRAADADRINEEHDVYVVPFANAFRPQFQATLARWTALVERLRIPVVVLGVGAQAGLDGGFEPLAPLDADVRRFVRAVLERGPAIGVRGEFTAAYLRHLGFRDVEVIGCPSVFLNGPRLSVTKRAERVDRSSRIVFNTAPSQVSAGPILASLAERFPNLTYVAQDRGAIELLALGRRGRTPAPPGFPAERTHRLVREGRLRVFPEPYPWIDFLRGVDFVFGSRAHGNLVSLIAGTPSYVLAHDSRTLELARYFELPHRPLAAVTPDLDPAELYEEADYGPLNAGHAGRWAVFERYLHLHGLRHVFEAGGAEQFDSRIAAMRYPIPGARGSSGGTLGLTYRLRRRLRHANRRVIGKRERRARTDRREGPPGN